MPYPFDLNSQNWDSIWW